MPYILVQIALAALVFMVPQTVHQLEAAALPVPESSPAADLDVLQQMEEMAGKAGADDASGAPAAAASASQ